jgi:hypothetical protein
LQVWHFEKTGIGKSTICCSLPMCGTCCAVLNIALSALNSPRVSNWMDSGHVSCCSLQDLSSLHQFSPVIPPLGQKGTLRQLTQLMSADWSAEQISYGRPRELLLIMGSRSVQKLKRVEGTRDD